MLSSGTLSLKFMQRNSHNKSQNLKPKIESNSSSNRQPISCSGQSTAPRNSEDTSAHLKTAKRKWNDLESSTDLSPNPTSNWIITYEESLINFPFLCSNSRLYSSLSTTLPSHLGQKSFGHSKKSSENRTQKLDQAVSSIKKQSKHDLSTASQPEKVSKNLETEPQSSSKSSHRVPIQKQVQSSSKFHSETSSTVDQDLKNNPIKLTTHDTKIQTGFKRPFNSTFIKSKDKQTRDFLISSTHQSHTTPPNKIIKLKNSKRTQQHQSITVNDHDDSSHSDDAELVNKQIEMMFTEARKAQLAPPH